MPGAKSSNESSYSSSYWSPKATTSKALARSAPLSSDLLMSKSREAFLPAHFEFALELPNVFSFVRTDIARWIANSFSKRTLRGGHVL